VDHRRLTDSLSHPEWEAIKRQQQEWEARKRKEREQSFLHQDRKYRRVRKDLGLPDFPEPSPHPPVPQPAEPAPEPAPEPEPPTRRGRGHPPGPKMPDEEFVVEFPKVYDKLCRELERRPTAKEIAQNLKVQKVAISQWTLRRYLGRHPNFRAKYPLYRQRSS
jgi:hypothetical protein